MIEFDDEMNVANFRWNDVAKISIFRLVSIFRLYGFRCDQFKSSRWHRRMSLKLQGSFLGFLEMQLADISFQGKMHS